MQLAVEQTSVAGRKHGISRPRAEKEARYRSFDEASRTASPSTASKFFFFAGRRKTLRPSRAGESVFPARLGTDPGPGQSARKNTASPG
ncbi:hypothetical protein PUN28_016730 [Cardiocondyla obscurior]|uniref:Uncharacterized protein n=1 Tax=Cardiocondyla obscurior TaxID=286306 RepID=A0AAW2EQL1_9HYME